MIIRARKTQHWQPTVLVLCLLALLTAPGTPAPEAFIFTALKGIAKAGKVAKAGKAGTAAAGGAILLDGGSFLRKVAPQSDDVWRIAANVDDAGNLHLINANGGEWVVRSFDDMASLPDPRVQLARREVYVADEVLWQNLKHFERLPDNTALFVVRDGKTPHRVRRDGATWDERIFPWLPTSVMWFLIVNWVCGIFTMATLWRWWTTLWPLLPFKQSPRKWLWVFAAPLRVNSCLALFMPLAGASALAFNVTTFLWVLCVTLPYRLIQRLVYRIQMFTMRRQSRRQLRRQQS